MKLDDQELIGRDALRARAQLGPQKKLVTLVVATKDAPAHAGASLIVADTVVGTVTSGDWGHRVGLNLAYAFVDPAYAAPGCEMHVDLCGALVKVQVIETSPYDPTFARMRG